MGRSRKVTGPYLDNMGVDMLEGGGKLFAGSRGRHVGPGHFGLLDLGQGVQKFSLHYEADLDRGGVSVLDIRPLLWRDGWPVAGDNFTAGHLHDRIRAHRHRARARGAGFSGGRISPAPSRAAAGPPPEPQAGPARRRPGARAGRRRNWPAATDVRLAPAMLQAQQKWVIAPVANAGGYPGSPFFRITIAGTERSLTATPGGELTAVAVHRRAGTIVAHRSARAMAAIASAPKAVPGDYRQLVAVRRRQQHADACRSSIPPAIASAGCWSTVMNML